MILYIFNISEILGRSLPNYYIISLKNSFYLSFARIFILILAGIISCLLKFNYINVSFIKFC